MSKVYICNTYYHVYISLVKTIIDNRNKINSSIVLCDQIDNYENLKQKLNESNIFEKVYVVKDSEYSNEVFGKGRRKLGIKLLYLKSKVNRIYGKIEFINDITKKDIYVFNDSTILFQYIFSRIDKCYLIEDGLRTYDPIKFKLIRKIIFKLTGYPLFLKDGRYDKAVKIEVSNIDRIIDSRKSKVQSLELKKYTNNLSEKEKKLLMNIFSMNKVRDDKRKRLLILTQPLSEDEIVSEKEKIDFYKNLILKNQDIYDDIYIKNHPRDNGDYCIESCENLICLNKNMPSEILNMLPNNYFDLAIAIYSTAIQNLEISKERVNLFSSLDDFKNRREYKYETGLNNN